MRVLALTRYGTRAASTRQRFVQYSRHLANAGIDLQISPLFDDLHVAALASGKDSSLPYLAGRYLHRATVLLSAPKFDLLWVHCELFPFFPGFIERIGTARRRVVFDFDDAIFHKYDVHPSGLVRAVLGRKLEPLLRRAAAATCGNEYLREYAARFCANSIVLPTVVDTEVYRPGRHERTDPPLIGWIGSPSTWCNVQMILPVLRDLCADGRARVRAIGAGHLAERDRFPGLELVEWSEATEVVEVQNFDIGIMPLIDAPFQRGKSGFKLIQYMACGVPAVGSPVGVNQSILEGGCGLLAGSLDEWKCALLRLLDEAELRSSLAEAGRKRAVERFSLRSQAPRLIELFRSVSMPVQGPSR